MDYIDLYLLHWPNEDIDHRYVLDELLEAKSEWLIRKIWVSNFTIDYLDEAIDHTEWQIFTNQLEHHVYLWIPNIREFMYDNNIALTAYSPLARWRILHDDTLKDIADKHNVPVVSVALSRIQQESNWIVIPKSSKPEHIEDNLKINTFVLDDEDMDRINNLPKNQREIDPPFAPIRDD